MNHQGDSFFLSPEILNDTSRYSTPRSSICDGASTDCEADVESNLSANSENFTPCRRRSSQGIYGIAAASKSIFASQNNQQTKQNTTNLWPFNWNLLSTVQKSAIVSVLIASILLLFSLVLLFPTCDQGCQRNRKTHNLTNSFKKNWPIEFKRLSTDTKMTTADVNLDGMEELILVLSRQTEKGNLEEQVENTSLLLAIDSHSGETLKRVELRFHPFWIDCDSRKDMNATCFLASSTGTAAKVSMLSEKIIWSFSPCQRIHSVSKIRSIYGDTYEDLILVCSWSSTDGIMISGIALLSNKNGDVIGSKIRYQLNQQPSSFLMQHVDARNNTCILFGTHSNKKSTVWAVRLKRLVEIATGSRKKVNLVSENPLLVVKNARTEVKPIHQDISGDGVKEIGFALQDGLIAFINGATFKLHKTINVRPGNIIRLSMLPVKNFKRLLLGVFKEDLVSCNKATLSIFDFRHSFDPYVITLPHIPLIIEELDKPKKKLFAIAFGKSTETCEKIRASREQQLTADIETKARTRGFLTEAGQSMSRDANLEDSQLNDDTASDIDIEAIDKDVLDNLKEYVGIDDRGVTKNHKLFHLVCNYLLLRFLISYGITTESILKDFRSTRYHLLNVSNRNLGHALTDQLKGLLATDYSRGRDSIMSLNQEDNDIDWLTDVNSKDAIQRKRRDTGGEGINSPENGRPQLVKINVARKIEPVSPKPITEQIYDNDIGLNGFLHQNEIQPHNGLQESTPKQGNEMELDSKNHKTKLKTYTAIPEASQVLKSSTLWRQRASKMSANKSKHQCKLPVPNIKMLEIDKENYRWRNITVQQDETPTGRLPSSEVTCHHISLQVKDILISKNRVYYVTVLKPITKGDVITQLSWVKLRN